MPRRVSQRLGEFYKLTFLLREMKLISTFTDIMEISSHLLYSYDPLELNAACLACIVRCIAPSLQIPS